MSLAVITGASAGLGEVFAELFAKDKHDVLLVARRVDKLDALAARLRSTYGVKATTAAIDLAAPGAADRVVQAAGGDIDFLVNNAGYATSGPFAELDMQRELAMIALNVTALVHLTRLVLPGMVARGRGRVLNIGSTAGFQAGPYMAVYYATKAFVVSFSEALWHELEGTGVTVTVSCPGATATEFAAVAGTEKSRLFRSGVASAESVAHEAYDAMHRGKRLVIHGAKNRFLFHGLRVSPRVMAQKIAGRLNQPPTA